MGHRSSALGAEILHDHFLDVSVLFMQVANRDQRIDALFQSLANANQNASGEWNLLPSGIFDDTKTLRRFFIGSVIVGGIFPEQPRACRFQHEPQAGSHAGQAFQPLRAHHAGIGVW